MTPQEKRLVSQLVVLHGLVLEAVPAYAETQPPKERESIMYHVGKVDEAIRKLFNSIRYTRTPKELEDVLRFVQRSKLYLLAPEDEELAEKVAEAERRWIEAAG